MNEHKYNPEGAFKKIKTEGLVGSGVGVGSVFASSLSGVPSTPARYAFFIYLDKQLKPFKQIKKLFGIFMTLKQLINRRLYL